LVLSRVSILATPPILASANSTFCVLICFLLGIFRHIYLFTIPAFLIAEVIRNQNKKQTILITKLDFCLDVAGLLLEM
jgi:hypothetical protein